MNVFNFKDKIEEQIEILTDELTDFLASKPTEYEEGRYIVFLTEEDEQVVNYYNDEISKLEHTLELYSSNKEIRSK